MMDRELKIVLDEKCPGWVSGTLLLKDNEGRIAGYGFIRPAGEGVEITATSDPSGVRLLSASPQSEDA